MLGDFSGDCSKGRVLCSGAVNSGGILKSECSECFTVIVSPSDYLDVISTSIYCFCVCFYKSKRVKSSIDWTWSAEVII